MKILIAASSGESLTNFRGKMIEQMVQYGHQVICLSAEPVLEMKESINKLGAEYISLEMERVGTNPFKDLKVIKKFKKIIKQINPDMFFAYMSKPVAYGGYAARKCKVKSVNFLINGLENAYYRKDIKSFILRRVLNFFYRYAFKKADNVFFQNADDMKLFCDNKISSYKQSSVVDGSGVDMTHYTREEMPEKFSLIMVARLLWSKGIREYVAAAKIVKQKYPEIEFNLIGGLDCNQEAMKKEELDTLIKENIIKYHGKQKDVRPYLSSSTVFCLPSYHEGLPRSVLEAMATGRPILTTNVPGCKDTVIDGYNGFIVEKGDSVGLANKIIELYENQDLVKTMSENSYKRCTEKYEVKIINRYLLEKMNIEEL